MKIQRVFGVVIALLLVEFTTFSQNVNFQALNVYLAKARADFGVTGMAVSVIKEQDVVFQNGYGFQNAENQTQKINTYSTFGIASVTKAFTATAIALLAHQEKLNLHDKVITHLPNFKLHDPVITNLLTVEDLLCHRSGLATFDGDLLWYGSNYTRKQVIERIQHRPLSKEFRDEFGYQNIMYLVAGEIIEKVTGKTWDEYITEAILQPLGMGNTSTSISNIKKPEEVAYPHINNQKLPLQNYDNSGPAASIHTNITDLARWIKCLVNKGIVEGNQIIPNQVLEQTFQPRINFNTSQNDVEMGIHFKSYALGWFVMDYEGRKVLYHGGGLPGYISQMVIVPEENLGFVVLSSGMTSLPYALMFKLLDEFLGKKSKKTDWAAEFLTYKKDDDQAQQKAIANNLSRKVKKPEMTFSSTDLIGIYEDKMYGKAEIKQVKNKLILTLLPSSNLFTATLEPWTKDEYRIKFADPFLPEGFVIFYKNDNLKPGGFKIDLPNPDFHFHKLNFVKQ